MLSSEFKLPKRKRLLTKDPLLGKVRFRHFSFRTKAPGYCKAAAQCPQTALAPNQRSCVDPWPPVSHPRPHARSEEKPLQAGHVTASLSRHREIGPLCGHRALNDATHRGVHTIDVHLYDLVTCNKLLSSKEIRYVIRTLPI